MSHFRISSEQIQEFDEQGFLVVPGLLSAEEIDLLGRIARADHEMARRADSRADGEGGAVKIHVENELADDLYSAIVRSERIVATMSALLKDEVYHYHHKMILKEPRVGGAWAWHQDYGYWYNFGCLFPDLASCMIAVDRATKSNGCLQVLAGSHRMGRIDHVKIGDQTGADPERVRAACERLPLVHCELEPGSAIFFHSNLLHRSDQNHSENPRWAYICCYNSKHNDPWNAKRHPGYSPLEVWPDDRLLEFARQQWSKIESQTKRV